MIETFGDLVRRTHSCADGTSTEMQIKDLEEKGHHRLHSDSRLGAFGKHLNFTRFKPTVPKALLEWKIAIS